MSKLIITIVAALAIAAVVTAIVIPNLNPSDPEKQYAIEFEDGEGNLIQLESAPESIVCINTLPAIAMKILGLQDKVDEILFYKTANKYQYYHDAGFNNITEDTPFYSTLTTADYFVEHNMKVIVETIGASPMSETSERSCKDNGITIIKLDCYGDTMLEDMEKLVKLFGNPASSVKALNDYKSLRNGVISGVLSKCSPSDDNLFLFEMMGLGAFYNENGEVAKVVEKIYGKNAVREMGLAHTTKSTTTAKGDGPLESLTVIDGNKPIKLLLLRASAGDGVTELTKKWNDNVIKNYKLSYLDDDSVFCVDSELLTGTMDYIGYVAIAQLCGIETGYDLGTLTSQYEELYGFPKESSTNIWQFHFDNNGDLTSITDFEAA